MLWVSLFAALTAVGGFIRIPTPPVPITLQTFFVYLAGNLLGSKKGAGSQGIFLIAGLIGVPVFGSGGGPGYIFQPTFGYLLSFPAAAWLIGKLQPQKKYQTWWTLILSNCAGGLLILFIGVTYLYICMNWIVKTPLAWTHALWTGLLIFLPGEAIKIILAVSLSRKIDPILNIG